MKKIALRCTTCAGLGLLLLPLAVLAADGDHLNDQNTPRPQYLKAKPKPEEQFKLPAVDDSVTLPEKVTYYKIDRFEFRGNTVFPQQNSKPLLRPMRGVRSPSLNSNNYGNY